jgi:hypothetical protein
MGIANKFLEENIMIEVCGDNRFEVIEEAKVDLIESTNISSSQDEMQVLDSILFRAWQMGWLAKYDKKNMTFGDAIEALKDGERVARKGWNGKDMYVFLAHEADFVTDADISAFDQLEVEVHDMLVMKTAQDTFQPGWLASQADMLAEDWYIVE